MKKTNKALNKWDSPRLINDKTPFAVRESFNQLRTNLMYALASTDSAPVYAIASVSESAGKSTLIANLALSFAQIEKKVLLVDADMRCPMQFRFFGLDSNQAGLSELISGISSDVTVKNVRTNLDVITSGRIPPNPSELLSSPRFLDLIHAWKKEYDIIFFDFPPLGVVSDALSCAQEMTGYIFTVRSNQNHVKQLTSAIESMERVGAKIAGIVLNDYNMKGNRNIYRSRYATYDKYRYRRTVAEISSNEKESASKQ